MTWECNEMQTARLLYTWKMGFGHLNGHMKILPVTARVFSERNITLLSRSLKC